MQPFGALANLKADPRAFLESLEPVALDGRVVHEYVFTGLPPCRTREGCRSARVLSVAHRLVACQRARLLLPCSACQAERVLPNPSPRLPSVSGRSFWTSSAAFGWAISKTMSASRAC